MNGYFLIVHVRTVTRNGACRAVLGRQIACTTSSRLVPLFIFCFSLLLLTRKTKSREFLCARTQWRLSTMPTTFLNLAYSTMGGTQDKLKKT
jgi:hypothetical protein